MTAILDRQHKVRARLARTHPVLYPACPDACEHISDYSVRVTFGEPGVHDGLLDAAGTLLRCVQDELAARPSPLEAEVGYQLGLARLWCLHAAAAASGSHRHAKLVELEHTHGRPLAVCLGFSPGYPDVGGVAHGFRRGEMVPVARHGAVVSTLIPSPGCGAVVPDATRLGGRMWRQWCDGCAPSRGQATRRLAAAHRRAHTR